MKTVNRLWILVVLATQIYCCMGEDFTTCDNVIEGATNISFARNETCIYIQCSDFLATVDIPTALLRGYKNFSHHVLVTEDGCAVKEFDLRSNGGLLFVRLNVPFESCGVKRKKSPGMVHFVGSPYLSYIGDSWEVYVINVTCIIKIELPRSKVNWENVPVYEHECWSLSNEFSVPAISNLSVEIQHLGSGVRAGESGSVFIYALNQFSNMEFDEHSFVWRYSLREDMKVDLDKYSIGQTEKDKAYGITLPYSRRSTIVEAHDETGKTASFSLLPICAYGYEYVVISYPSRESFIIISSLFTISWSLPANVIVYDERGKIVMVKQLPFFVTTYIRNAVTGYRILSDMPIAVYSIMLDAKVPYDSPVPTLTTDHMAEQLLPVTLWSSEYIIHPSGFGLSSSDSPGFVLRIVTYKRPVHLLYSGCPNVNLVTLVPAFSYRDMNFNVTSPFIIRSTDSTNFMAVIIGKSSDDKNPPSKGYPYMIQASPIKSFTSVAHSHPFGKNDKQFFSLVKKESTDVYFNEHKLPAAAWNAIPCSTDQYKMLDVKGNEAESSVFFTKSSSEVFEFSVYTTATNGKGYNAYMGPAVFIHEQPQDSICEVGWTYHTDSNKCIHISRSMVTWRTAKLNCEKFTRGNSSLVILKDANIENFVVQLMAQLRIEQAFLGVHLINGMLRWVNGQTVDSNVLSLNPQGPGNPNINCGVMVVKKYHVGDRQIFLSASNCDMKRPYICEKDPLSPVVRTTSASPSTAPSSNTTCDQIIGGAMNVSHAISSSCIYFECNVNETIVDIPVELLEGYQDYSYMVLVTEDGCSVEQYDKRNEGGLYFIRLHVPHNNCSTQMSVLSGDMYYTNRPYIAYIGDEWKIKFIDTKCKATIGTTPYTYTTAAALSTSSMGSESFSTATVAPLSSSLWRESSSPATGSITTSATPTEQITTSPPPSDPCITSPCKNNGSCTSGPNGHLCTCPPAYFGPECEWVAPFENGIYLVTATSNVDFNVLFNFVTRRRRAVTGKQVAFFEVIGFSNMCGLRSVEHCPEGPSCLGFLTVNDNSSVYLASASLGPFMWFIVREENGYLLRSASSNRYITYQYEYGFHMSQNRTEAIVFEFQMTNKSFENSLHMTRFELTENSNQTLPIDIIALLAGNANCPAGSKGVTVCTWFLPFSPNLIPSFLLLKTTYDNITSILRSNSSRTVISSLIKSVVIGSVHMLTTDSTHIKIVVTSSAKKLIAETETISQPSGGIRHHMCFQNKQVHIDGASFNFINVDSSWDDMLNSEFLFVAIGTDDSVDFKSPTFIGQIDDFKVWCGSQSTEYIHSAASFYAECNGIQSSLYSQQSGHIIATETVKNFVVATPGSACQFCKAGWTLGQGSCYYVVKKEEPAPNTINLQTFSYKYCNALEPQHSSLVPAYVKTKAAHISVARLVASVLHCSNKFAWIGLERINDKYRWSSDGTILNETYWIQSEPSLIEALACVGYKPSTNKTEWKSTSLQAPNIEPPVSLYDYGWAEDNCNSLYPHVCQHKAYSFTPGKDTLLQIVITGGSFLLHMGSPAIFQSIREAITEIVNTVSDSMAGYVLYQIYEGGREPFLLVSSDVKPIVLSVIQSWLPMEGENNLANTLNLFHETSTNSNWRYINIVTMYYNEEHLSLQSKSVIAVQSGIDQSVVIFSLGFMFASEKNLKQVASHPSCQCLFQGSVCQAGLTTRLLRCIKGTYIFDNLDFILPTSTSVTSLAWTPADSKTSVQFNTTAIATTKEIITYSTGHSYTASQYEALTSDNIYISTSIETTVDSPATASSTSSKSVSYSTVTRDTTSLPDSAFSTSVIANLITRTEPTTSTTPTFISELTSKMFTDVLTLTSESTTLLQELSTAQENTAVTTEVETSGTMQTTVGDITTDTLSTSVITDLITSTEPPTSTMAISVGERTSAMTTDEFTLTSEATTLQKLSTTQENTAITTVAEIASTAQTAFGDITTSDTTSSSTDNITLADTTLTKGLSTEQESTSITNDIKTTEQTSVGVVTSDISTVDWADTTSVGDQSTAQETTTLVPWISSTESSTELTTEQESTTLLQELSTAQENTAVTTEVETSGTVQTTVRDITTDTLSTSVITDLITSTEPPTSTVAISVGERTSAMTTDEFTLTSKGTTLQKLSTTQENTAITTVAETASTAQTAFGDITTSDTTSNSTDNITLADTTLTKGLSTEQESTSITNDIKTTEQTSVGNVTSDISTVDWADTTSVGDQSTAQKATTLVPWISSTESSTELTTEQETSTKVPDQENTSIVQTSFGSKTTGMTTTASILTIETTSQGEQSTALEETTPIINETTSDMTTANSKLSADTTSVGEQITTQETTTLVTEIPCTTQTEQDITSDTTISNSALSIETTYFEGLSTAQEDTTVISEAETIFTTVATGGEITSDMSTLDAVTRDTTSIMTSSEFVSNSTTNEESARTVATTSNVLLESTITAVDYIPTGVATEEMSTTLSSFYTIDIETATATTERGLISTASSNPQDTCPFLGRQASCPSGYEGVNCTERAPPSSGATELSSSVDLSGLFPSNGGRRKRSLTSLLLDIIEINGGFIIRTLRSCPSGTYCMWFLNVHNDRVMFNSPVKGYHIWIFIPLSDKDSYNLQSRFNGQFVQYNNGRFLLSADASSAVTFKLSSVPSSALNNLTEEKIYSSRVVFFKPSSAETYVKLPLSNSSTSFKTTTVCFWFRAFSSSPVSFPHLSFSSDRSNYSIYEESIVSTARVRLEIGTASTQGYTYQFSPLPKQHWHLICLLSNATTLDIYIDGLKLNWLLAAPNITSPIAVKIAECTRVSNSCFTGYLREANVWSRHLTVSEIHSVFTSVCSPFKGDVFSSSQNISGVGLSYVEDSTPRLICKYCTFGWTLSESTCYHLVETVQSTIEEYLQNTCIESANSNAASILNYCNHASVASLMDAQFGYQLLKFPSISLKYMSAEGRFRWWLHTTLEESGNNTFWSAGQPNISSGNCVVYRATNSYINSTVLTGWPSSIPGVLPQPSNYMWHSANCSQHQPYICQMSAVFLNTEKNIQISVVLQSDDLSFESTLRDLVNIAQSTSTVFRFIEGKTIFTTSTPGQYLDIRPRKTSPGSTESMLKLLMGCNVYFSNRTQCAIIVTSENPSNLSSVKTRTDPSVYVFALGLKNATLAVVQKLASKPEFAYLISNTSASYSLLRTFQQFLLECSQRNISDICTDACSTLPCQNGGTCKLDVIGFTCSCAYGYVGDRCQFNASEVHCGDLGITVKIPADIIRFLFGSLNTSVPTDIIIYFGGQKNDSDCRVTSPLATLNNKLAYQLYVPSPFDTCGLKQETISAKTVKVFGHVVYERVTNISNIDISVIVVNFSCFYQTRYKVGLRPDEGLSALFRPLPNRLFSQELKKMGKINIDLRLFRDPLHNNSLPPNPTLIAGSFVYVSVFSVSPLPNVMAIHIDECYVSASQDASNLSLIVPIVTDNCAADNLAPKNLTLVTSDKINFMYQVFLWAGSNDELFLHCNTTICDASDLGCSNINCSANRVRRQAGNYDWVPQQTVIKSVPIRVIAVEEKQETTEAHTDYLNKKDDVYPYVLAGLIIFTILFFSISLTVILHSLRRQDPRKHIIHSKCSYRPGRSVSESLPHDWTAMHSACVSPSPHAGKVISRRDRIFATTEDPCGVPRARNLEGVFNTGISQQFTTFLGQHDNDTQLQNPLRVIEESSSQQNTN